MSVLVALNLRKLTSTAVPLTIQGTLNKHVDLFRRLQCKWQCFDAYARVCMALGANQLLDSIFAEAGQGPGSSRKLGTGKPSYFSKCTCSGLSLDFSTIW